MAAHHILYALSLGILAGSPLLAGVNRWTRGTPPPGQDAIGWRSLVADASNPDRAFAASYYLGIFRSDDRGLTWIDVDEQTQIPIFSRTRSVTRILQSADGATLYAVLPNMILETTDAGVTWSSGARLDTPFSRYATDVLVDPHDGATIHQAAQDCFTPPCTGRGFVEKSTDGGESWTSIGSATEPGSLRLFRGVAPGAAVFAVAVDELLRTDAAGFLSPIPGAPSISRLATDASDENRIWGAGLRFFQSDDQGLTWATTDESGYPISNPSALAVDPIRPSHLCLGTEGTGVHCSSDGGRAWKALNEGLDELQIDAVVFSVDGATLYAGARGAVYQYTFCDACPRRVDPARPPTRIVAPRFSD